jgi:16S rRNA (guanine(966)-N(2))-methyltransferase RsmD
VIIIRVISGIYKSRILKGYNLIGTRPTMDKVKESLFSMIQFSLKDSICLDLFAGSGSLGIEALSNGAKHVYFVDNNSKVIDILKDNINTLKISNSSILLKDYNSALNYFKDNNIKFDLILLDPPYKLNLINDILEFISTNNLLNNNGQVICEYEYEKLGDEYGKLICIKSRNYGTKNIKIYKI